MTSLLLALSPLLLIIGALVYILVRTGAPVKTSPVSDKLLGGFIGLSEHVQRYPLRYMVAVLVIICLSPTFEG